MEKVYKALIRLVSRELSAPLYAHVRHFLYPFFTVTKLLLHKALSDLSCIFGREAKLSPVETTNPTPLTVSCH